MKIKEIFGYAAIALVAIGIFVGIYWINLKPHYDKAATEKSQELLLGRQVEALERIADALEGEINWGSLIMGSDESGDYYQYYGNKYYESTYTIISGEADY